MFLSIRQDKIKRLLQKLYQSSHSGFANVELKFLFSELSFNIIMRMVAGKRYFGENEDSKEAKHFRKLIDEAFSLGVGLNLGDFLPLLRWIDYKGHEKNLARLSAKMDAFLQDTSAVTIEWALSALLNHQEKLERAKAEIDSLVGNDRLVVESDLSKLHYLQAIISETFRLFPAVPLLVPHEASYNCKIGGYDIPRGTRRHRVRTRCLHFF
ncbi:unnamed protein product [Fraxinus pennsylvanica]|uniref:Cytochrome P450 n=1 Tax=Fraxinus pennsylvanica TaxID=56036 RepID=A0AAD2AI62_9LAMI|nr:unnamed protein product [Fraxinus pennsylvanica]